LERIANNIEEVRGMRVLFVSAEVSPFAKVGGLADVALARLGVEIAVVMPKYRGVAEKANLIEAARFSVPVGKDDKEFLGHRFSGLNSISTTAAAKSNTSLEVAYDLGFKAPGRHD
jgi:glycogen synthase